MNKEKLGSVIVDDIINAYKKSDDFEIDAVDFVLNEILNEINAVCSNVGYKFVSGGLNPDTENEFRETINVCNNQKKIIIETFKQVFGEGSKLQRPGAKGYGTLHFN